MADEPDTTTEETAAFANPYAAAREAVDNYLYGEHRLQHGSVVEIGKRDRLRWVAVFANSWVQHFMHFGGVCGFVVLAFMSLYENIYMTIIVVLGFPFLWVTLTPFVHNFSRNITRRQRFIDELGIELENGVYAEINFIPRLPYILARWDEADDLGKLALQGDVLVFRGDRLAINLNRNDIDKLSYAPELGTRNWRVFRYGTFVKLNGLIASRRLIRVRFLHSGSTARAKAYAAEMHRQVIQWQEGESVEA